MTKSQAQAIERLKKMIPRSFFYGENYEIKNLEIKDHHSFISFFVETGMVGDEGTMAEIFARYTAHLFIGKHGGITYPVNNKNGEMKTKQFGRFDTLLTVHIAQDIKGF